MHADAFRKHGGIGFSIAGPRAVIEIRAADQLRVQDKRNLPFTPAEIDQLLAIIKQPFAGQQGFGADVTIAGEMRTHVGMGSGTAIRLAIIEGLHLLNDLILPPKELVNRSGRGGTSGIGVSTYFSGGLAFDLGIANDGSPFIPSSRSSGGRSPTTLPSLPMPDWPLCLCVPRSISPKTQAAEVEFFARTAPLTAAASYRACYEALFGVYASVLDADYSAFCRAVEAMQATDWKSCEWYEYGERLRLLKLDLKRRGAACVGMSSLGPMLFCFAHPAALEAIGRDQELLDCDVFQTVPNGKGRVISRTLG
jgi:beta-ribofuranosylaminobenzene 5'-phosphate synthase